MILGKFWQTFRAQLNKLANFLWAQDPVAHMQYEYDLAVDQLKEGRKGLEQFRALVERVSRQVADDKTRIADLEAKIKAYLQAGNRQAAGDFAVQLQQARKALTENEAQLKLHEEAYQVNLTKIKNAGGKLAQVKEKIARYHAELKMTQAEAEMAKLSQDLNFDLTTDFGRFEQLAQDQINLNRARVRVAGDLAGEGAQQIQDQKAMEKARADLALREFEVQMGLVTPETANVQEAPKHLGPSREIAQ
jgi:phage shock protein A